MEVCYAGLSAQNAAAFVYSSRRGLAALLILGGGQCESLKSG